MQANTIAYLLQPGVQKKLLYPENLRPMYPRREPASDEFREPVTLFLAWKKPLP